MEEEISPEELEHLKDLGRKIKSGKRLSEVTIDVVADDGTEQQIVVTDPKLLEAFEYAALLVYAKHCKE